MRATRVGRFVSGLAAVTVGVGLLTPATPAMAAQEYHLSTFGDAGPGWVTTNGTIRFNGPHSFTVNGHVDDHCPSNGYGGHVDIVYEYMNGTVTDWDDAGDTDGNCEALRTPYGGTITRPNRLIKRARAVLFEMNGAGDFIAYRLGDWKDNPHTG
jgi:hypothetical protein